jgi:hypothetical protein
LTRAFAPTAKGTGAAIPAEEPESAFSDLRSIRRNARTVRAAAGVSSAAERVNSDAKRKKNSGSVARRIKRRSLLPTPRKHADTAAKHRAYRERAAASRAAEREAKGLPKAPAIPTIPGTARWAALIEVARAALETAAVEMQGYYDDRSEAWQEGDRGESLRAKLEAIEAVVSEIEGLPE